MPKLSLKILFFVQIFQLFFAVNLLFAPVPASAADPVKLKLEVPINVQKDAQDTYDFKSGEIDITKDKSTRAIAEYVKVIYKYGIGAVGIVSAIILMIGGLIWLTAGGSSERISEAKSWILSSLTGLILAICSYTILLFINPNLVNFKIHKIQNVAGYKFCCDLNKGVSSIEKNGGNCPKNAVPYDNQKQDCKIGSNNRYNIVNKNINCCQFRLFWGVVSYYTCTSGENYTEENCKKDKATFDFYQLMENSNCEDGTVCK